MKIHKCIHCQEPMPVYQENYVCMKEGCNRYGLLTIVSNVQEIKEG